MNINKFQVCLSYDIGYFFHVFDVCIALHVEMREVLSYYSINCC